MGTAVELLSRFLVADTNMIICVSEREREGERENGSINNLSALFRSILIARRLVYVVRDSRSSKARSPDYGWSKLIALKNSEKHEREELA
jgi:hypothetical protein